MNHDEFDAIRGDLRELRQLLETRTAPDPSRDQAVQRLYDELKHHRDRAVAEAEKPLMLDLLMLYDSFHWFHQTLVKQEMSPEVIADSFQFLVDELLEILYRRDVVPMEIETKFDRTMHKAVEVQPAPSADADGAVVRILKRGFMRQESVLRPAEVVVNRWQGDG